MLKKNAFQNPGSAPPMLPGWIRYNSANTTFTLRYAAQPTPRNVHHRSTSDRW